jgi:hypothetical protein
MNAGRPKGSIKQFCHRGHKLYYYTLYFAKNGKRRCKLCKRLKEREYFYKKMLKKIEKQIKG